MNRDSGTSGASGASGNRRQWVKAGTLSAGVLLVALLLVMANYFGWKYFKRFDWTETRLYSLSEKTKGVLAGLDRDVEAVVFLAPNDSQDIYGPTRELLTRYAAASPRFKVKMVDPERNPVEAAQLVRRYEVENAGVVLVSGEERKVVDAAELAEFDYSAMQMGGPPKMAGFKGEQVFTNALIQLSGGEKPKALFTTGHGEASLDGLEARGLSAFRELLQGDNFEVEEWASLGKPAVPEGTDLVVIAGPTGTFLPPELDALQRYLDDGGRLLALLDPVLAQPSGLVATGLEALLQGYGAKVGANIVVDPSNPLPMFGAETLFSNLYGDHAITKPLQRQGLPVLVSLARSVGKGDGGQAQVTELLRTTDEGWGETNLADLTHVAKDGSDLAGPVPLGVAIGGDAEEAPGEEGLPEAPKPPSGKAGPRLVVLGDSDLATNQLWNASVGNSILLANAVNWLVERPSLIAVPPKKTEQVRLNLTSPQLRSVYLLVLLALPALSVAAGIAVYVRRRKR